MKVLAIALVLFACRSEKAPGVDRWPEIERLATPSLPGGDGVLLDKAFSQIKDDDVPEGSLGDAIAWRKVGGGLPWRGGREMNDPRPFQALKLGTALIERRAADPEAIATVLYLAQRLRAEAPALIDVALGYSLAQRVVDAKVARPPEYAPVDAEIRRGLAAEAIHFVKNLPHDDVTAKDVRAHYVALVLDAPSDRAGFLKHLEGAIAKAEKHPVGKLMAMPKLPSLVSEMFATVDAYSR